MRISDWSSDVCSSDLLTQGADRDALAGLLNEADVVILHMDPADRGCCGIDAARIAAEHPNLILCEITDLGAAGPFAGQPGSELAVQALAGLTRYAGSAQEPRRVGFATRTGRAPCRERGCKGG